MFITALLIAAKIRKQPKCPSMDEWIKKVWFTYFIFSSHTQQNHSALRNNEIMPFAATWMDLVMIYKVK